MTGEMIIPQVKAFGGLNSTSFQKFVEGQQRQKVLESSNDRELINQTKKNSVNHIRLG